VLRQFCKGLDVYLNDIKQYAREENTKLYATKIHAVKGMLSNIGSEKMSEWANRLEYCDKNWADAAFIKDSEAFCGEVEKLREALSNTGLMEESKPKIFYKISKDELKKNLDELIAACMSGDSDKVDEINESLIGSTLDEATDVALAELSELLVSFDYDIAIEKIKHII
jgi:HPt (histidine-containing phosphotransfer) domain-containing protein